VKSIKVSKIGLSRNGGVLPKEKSNFSLDFFLVLLRPPVYDFKDIEWGTTISIIILKQDTPIKP